MSDTTTAIALLEGYLGTPLSTGAAAEVAKQRTRVFSFATAADAMASTTTTEIIKVTVPVVGIVTGIYYQPDAAITSHDTNYFTVQMSKYTAAGATKVSLGTLVATLTGGYGGSFTKWVRASFTLSVVAGALNVEAGAPITFEVAKAASGLIVAAGVWSIHVKDQ